MHWDVALFSGDEGRWRAISKHPHGSLEEISLLPSYDNELLACLDRHYSALGSITSDDLFLTISPCRAFAGMVEG